MSQGGLINIQSSTLPSNVPINFITDSGTATATSNDIEILGSGGATTSALGNIITITAGAGSGVNTLSTDVSGPVSALANNIAVTGATNVFSDGSVANTLRLNLQGTNHALFVGRGTNLASSSITLGTTGTVLTGVTGGDPVWAAASSSGISTITGNSGGAESPLVGNFNVLGTGSITVVGSANTETVQLTGLTNHAVLIGAGTATITSVGPVASTGCVLMSNGVGGDPGFSTATYPSTAGTSQNALISNGTNFTSTDNPYPIGGLGYFSNANGSSYISNNWLLCDGSTYTQATYPTLYARLGLLNGGATTWTKRTGPTAASYITFGTIFVCISSGVTTGLSTSTDAITWTNRTQATASAPGALTYGNGLYIASSTSGFIQTSTDGISWYTATPNCGPSIGGPGLIYGAQYVASGGGSGLLYSSTDSISWKSETSGFAGLITALSYALSVYVAVGDSGVIRTSTDAVTWTPMTSNTASGLKAQTFGTIFVASGAGGAIVTSTDSITWAAQTSGTASQINALSYGVSTYVYGGAGGVVRSSTDAVTWTSRTSNTTSIIQTMTFGTVFMYATAAGGLGSSTDGITWTARTSGTASGIFSSTYGTVYVYGGAGGVLSSSTDAITWNARTSGVTSSILGLTYNGGNYYATGNNFVLTSTDATTWTAKLPPGSSVLALSYGASLYVFGGAAGVIYSSTDAITWTSRTSNTASQINAITFGTVFAYGTVNGGAGSSTDGITWTARTSNTTSTINAMTYGSVYVYVGESSTGNLPVIASSTDAITWTPRVSDTTTSPLRAITYGNGIYVAVGDTTMDITNTLVIGPNVQTSTDAITWVTSFITTATTSASNKLFSIAYGATTFAATCSGGSERIYTSSGIYPYNSATQFQVPTDNNIAITTNVKNNFYRSLYIKAL